MSADTGWTFDQVGRLTWPDYVALYEQFKVAPPLRMSLAAFIGWKGLRDGAKDGPAIDALDLIDFLPAAPGSKSKGVTLPMLALLG